MILQGGCSKICWAELLAEIRWKFAPADRHTLPFPCESGPADRETLPFPLESGPAENETFKTGLPMMYSKRHLSDVEK